MRTRHALVLVCLAATVLSACGDRAEPAGNVTPPAESRQGPSTYDAPAGATTPGAAPPPATSDAPGNDDSEALPPTSEGPTRGGDGSEITLRPLTPSDLAEVDLPGELACTFSSETGATLLLARADVTPDGIVRGAVNNNGYVEALGNGRAGGFDDLRDGITLGGKGLTVVLARGAAHPTGNESTQHAAILTVQRADGAERTYEGLLTCGP